MISWIKQIHVRHRWAKEETLRVSHSKAHNAACILCGKLLGNFPHSRCVSAKHFTMSYTRNCGCENKSSVGNKSRYEVAHFATTRKNMIYERQANMSDVSYQRIIVCYITLKKLKRCTILSRFITRKKSYYLYCFITVFLRLIFLYKEGIHNRNVKRKVK